ncbi:MAG: class I SAM-dependent methyltransferase [Streptomycetales bacterium]
MATEKEIDRERLLLHLSTLTVQFEYFNVQLGRPQWPGKKVLDFGGNIGGFLAWASPHVRPEDYWCLDVHRPAIDEGRHRFPSAHWHHYDRFNPQFNPEGAPGLPVPDLHVLFDYIIAYSVFTHTTTVETDELVDQLMAALVPGGALAFTFLDPHWAETPGDESNLQRRLTQRAKSNTPVDITALVELARKADWAAVVDGDLLFLDPRRDLTEFPRDTIFDVLCTPKYMQSIYPEAEILEPVPPSRMHCCVLTRT